LRRERRKRRKKKEKKEKKERKKDHLGDAKKLAGDAQNISEPHDILFACYLSLLEV